jgi:hypothetical protein
MTSWAFSRQFVPWKSGANLFALIFLRYLLYDFLSRQDSQVRTMGGGGMLRTL